MRCLGLPLGRVWLQRPESCRREASNCLHVVLDLSSYFAVADEGATDRPLVLVGLLILTLALPLVALDARKQIRVVLQILCVLILIHRVASGAAWISMAALNVCP